MTDGWGREIDYLRISVTDRCNLRCVYCMPEDGIESIGHSRIMSYDEIVRVCRIMAQHGLRKIKITGGEPLVRKDVPKLIGALKAIAGIENVTITTNGVLLEEYYDALVEAGIDAVTVSLDTMNREVYQKITRRDESARVLSGIEQAVRKNKVPLKINCVPIGDIDMQEIPALCTFAERADIDIRFIEMMPIGFGRQFTFVSEETVRAAVEERYGRMTLYQGRRGNGPCRYYTVPGLIGKVGFISAVSHKFCDRCNRVRLTADGFLKTCLQYDCGVPLKYLLEENASDEVLWKAIEEAVRSKPMAHHFADLSGTAEDEVRNMSQIGG